MKKQHIFIALLMALILVLTACGAKTEAPAESPEPTAAPETTAAPEPTAEPTPVPIPEPARVIIDGEGEFVASFGVEEISDDPEEGAQTVVSYSDPSAASKSATTPTPTPTAKPTPTPTAKPTPTPTAKPSPTPTAKPSPTPTAKPTPTPTATPAPTSIPEVSPVHVQTQYEWFINLSPAEQDAYKDSFGSLEAFFNWFNAAQAENNSTQNNFIELAPGETIDLSKY